MMGMFPIAGPPSTATNDDINFAGVQWDPDDTDITGEGGLVAFVTAYKTSPYIKDTKGLISDTTFASNYRSISSTGLSNDIMPVSAVNYTNITSASALQITGALSLRCLLSLTSSTDQTFVEMSDEGELESDNVVWLSKQPERGSLMFFCETGSGSNKSATWSVPGGLSTTADTPHLISFYRSAGGVVKCYWNDWQVMHMRSATGGAAIVGDGTASGLLASGGTASKLTIYNGTAIQVGFLGVYNTDNSSAHATFLTHVTGAELSANQLKSIEPTTATFTNLASETGTVALLVASSAKSSGWDDIKGYLDGDSAAQNSTATARLKKGSDIIYWSKDTAIFATSSKTDLRIRSNLTLRCLWEYDNSNNYVVAHTISSETEPKNYLYSISLDSSSVVQVLWESGAGVNRTSKFDLPASVFRGQILLLSIVRHDTGGGNCNLYCYLNGTRLNVNSVSGMTNNTTFTSGVLPTGGEDGSLVLLNDDAANDAKFGKMVHIIAGVDGTTASEFDAREATVAAIFGLT